MDLVQLKYFQAVARTGNITKAARELYITQPNLSKSIARLEAELEVPLFEHRKGRVELNDYGRMFLSSVDIAFAQLNSGVQNVRRMYEVDQNILSLACNISAYLPDILPRFCAKYSDIGIRQIDSSTQDMIEHLLDRSVTMGISYEEVNHESLVFEKLSEAEYVLAVNLDNPLSQKDVVSVQELKEETFICDLTRMGLEHLRNLCKEHGFTPKINFEVQSTDLIYKLLDGNLGVAVIPIGMACHILEWNPNNNIKLLRIKENLKPVIIGVAYHKAFRFTKAATMFLNYIDDCLQEENQLIEKMGYGALNHLEKG